MELVVEIVNSLLPLALLVAAGAALIGSGRLSQEFRLGLDWFVYWIALPALIVGALLPQEASGSGGVADGALKMIGVTCGGTVATAVVAAVVVKLLRRPRTEVGVFVQAAFRGNLAFVGLPVISLSVGGDAATLTRAALVFAPVVVLYNVLGVVGLVASQHRIDRALPMKLTRSLVTNPLLLACGLGLLLWGVGTSPPRFAVTTLDLLGRTAGPLALISLGGALVTYPVGRHAGTATAAAVLKCFASPALTGGMAWLVGLPAVDLPIVLVFAACPTAVASYVLATQLKGDPALASASIVISTLLTGVSLAGVLALT
jgi:predicted permease